MDALPEASGTDGQASDSSCPPGPRTGESKLAKGRRCFAYVLVFAVGAELFAYSFGRNRVDWPGAALYGAMYLGWWRLLNWKLGLRHYRPFRAFLAALIPGAVIATLLTGLLWPVLIVWVLHETAIYAVLLDAVAFLIARLPPSDEPQASPCGSAADVSWRQWIADAVTVRRVAVVLFLIVTTLLYTRAIGPNGWSWT